MKAFIRSVVLLICLCIIPAPLRAAMLVVGISNGYPPYYYQNNGELAGACIDIINSVAQEMGIKVTYKVYPWKRLILSAKKGDVDAIMPLFRTTERDSFLKFDGLELVYEVNQFFTKAGSFKSYSGTFDDMESFRIGVVAEYSYGKRFDSFDFPKKIITLDDKHLIEMFVYDRFDFGVGNKYVVRYYAELAGVAQSVTFIDPPITKEMLYLGFSKQGKQFDLAEKFAKTLQAFKRTVEYRELIDKYGMSGNN